MLYECVFRDTVFISVSVFITKKSSLFVTISHKTANIRGKSGGRTNQWLLIY